MAGTGPIPIMVGSTPTTENATILARGVRLCLVAASSLATITAPAPSQIPYNQVIQLHTFYMHDMTNRC
jgi:hypothetical protein